MTKVIQSSEDKNESRVLVYNESYTATLCKGIIYSFDSRLKVRKIWYKLRRLLHGVKLKRYLIHLWLYKDKYIFSGTSSQPFSLLYALGQYTKTTVTHWITNKRSQHNRILAEVKIKTIQDETKHLTGGYEPPQRSIPLFSNL